MQACLFEVVVCSFSFKQLAAFGQLFLFDHYRPGFEMVLSDSDILQS